MFAHAFCIFISKGDAMKPTIVLLSLSMLAVAPQQASAWGDDGHKTIALIARHYLTAAPIREVASAPPLFHELSAVLIGPLGADLLTVARKAMDAATGEVVVDGGASVG
jgi:hypothetical protein